MAEARWHRRMAQVRRLAAAGGEVEAIRMAFGILEAAPDYQPAWLFAAAAWCRQGGHAEVPALIDRYQALTGRGAVLVKEVLAGLLEEGQMAAAENLALAFPESHAGHLLGLYYRGCGRMRAGDDQAALALFARFREAVPRFTTVIPFLSAPFFNVIYRQGTLVAGSEAFAGDIPPPGPDPAPVWPAPPIPPDRRPVFVAAANNLYFNTFAEGLAQSAAALGLPLILHFHVINPDQASHRLIAALGSGDGECRVAVTTADLPPEAGAVWFSCSRFLIAPALLAAYRAPLWLLDIDLHLTAGLGRLVRGLSAPEGLDFACFDTGRLEPASRFSAATVLINDSPGAGRFLSLLARFIEPRLTLPLAAGWMLDQAALYSTICHCRRAEAGIAIADFGTLTGLGRDDVFISLHPETKNAMRWRPRSQDAVRDL